MATITAARVYHRISPARYCADVQCSNGVWYTDECWAHRTTQEPDAPYSGEESLALARAREAEWNAKIGQSCPWAPEPTPECEPEGRREILEYCWDGSTKRQRTCENGKWVEKTYECPTEPECSEGAKEVLEYCPDGYNVKREKVCVNGRWVEKTYTCPECLDGDREVLEFCPDGYNVRRERICENGSWREYNYDCPPEAECYEGQEEVLEYCPDGVTVKRVRICENGKWAERTYDCPPVPPAEEGIIDMIRRRIQEFRESLGR